MPSFLCLCFVFFFFHFQTQNGRHARLLERIWSNLQEFPAWLPPQSTLQSWKLFLPRVALPGSVLLEGSSSGGCSPFLGCPFQGHHLLLWRLNARVKRMYGFSFRFAICVWAILCYSWLTQSSSVMLTTVQKSLPTPFFSYLCIPLLAGWLPSKNIIT